MHHAPKIFHDNLTEAFTLHSCHLFWVSLRRQSCCQFLTLNTSIRIDDVRQSGIFFLSLWRREHLSKPLKISEAVFLELSLVPMGVWHTAAVNHFRKQKSNFWNLRVSVGKKIYLIERDFLSHKAQSLMTSQKGITALDFPFRFLCQTSVNEWISHLQLNSSALCLDSETHQLSAGS